MSVVFPASGWLMMANVRRRLTAAATGVRGVAALVNSGLQLGHGWRRAIPGGRSLASGGCPYKRRNVPRVSFTASRARESVHQSREPLIRRFWRRHDRGFPRGLP